MEITIDDIVLRWEINQFFTANAETIMNEIILEIGGDWFTISLDEFKWFLKRIGIELLKLETMVDLLWNWKSIKYIKSTGAYSYGRPKEKDYAEFLDFSRKDQNPII